MDEQRKSYTPTPEMLEAEQARQRGLEKGWELVEDIRDRPGDPEEDEKWLGEAIWGLMVGSTVGRIGV